MLGRWGVWARHGLLMPEASRVASKAAASSCPDMAVRLCDFAVPQLWVAETTGVMHAREEKNSAVFIVNICIVMTSGKMVAMALCMIEHGEAGGHFLKKVPSPRRASRDVASNQSR